MNHRTGTRPLPSRNAKARSRGCRGAVARHRDATCRLLALLLVLVVFAPGCRKGADKKDPATEANATKTPELASLPPTTNFTPTPTPTPTPAPSPAPTPLLPTPTILPTPVFHPPPSPTATPPPDPAPSAWAGTLGGRVLDADTGAAIAEATVRLIPLAGLDIASLPTTERKTTTDPPALPPPFPRAALSRPDGAFRFEGLEPGVYRVEARKGRAGLLSTIPGDEVRATLTARETRTDLVLSLHGGHVVRGEVRDRASGKPLDWVKVTAFDETGTPMVVAVTDDEGTYRLEGVLGPRIVLTAEKSGYALATRDQGRLTIPLGGSLEEVVRPLAMLLAAPVAGRVLDAEGAGVSGVRVAPVYADGIEGLVRTERTDAEGRFRTHVTPGVPVRLLARRESPATGASAAGTERRAGASPDTGFSALFEADAAGREGIEMVFAGVGAVRGRVLDPEGNPLTRGRVVAERPLCMGFDEYLFLLEETPIDERGAFRFPGLPGGGMLLTAWGEGVAPGIPLRFDLVPEAAPNETVVGPLLARMPRTLAGQVVGPDGTPLPGARVAARPAGCRPWRSWETWTDPYGRFSLTGLPTDEAHLRLDHPAHPERFVTGVALDGTDLVFAMAPPVSWNLIGRVVDWMTGETIADFTVSCNAPGALPDAALGESGAFKIENLPGDRASMIWIGAGTHPALAAPLIPPPAACRARPTTAKPSDPAALPVRDIAFEVGPSAPLVGRLVDSREGAPVRGADVLCLATGLTAGAFGHAPRANPFARVESERDMVILARTRTGSNGRFRIEEVLPPKTVLLIRPPNALPQVFVPVEGLQHGQETNVGTLRVQMR